MASDRPLIFLDANVLARLVTWTLLLAGADESGLAVTWSAYVETEADRHMRGSAFPVSDLRKRLDLGPPRRCTASSPASTRACSPRTRTPSAPCKQQHLIPSQPS